MKNLLILIFLTLSSNIFGFTLNVTSSALDLNNNPISNHWVYIEANDSINSFYYYDSTQTNTNGNYSFNVNNVPSQNIIFNIYTFDCVNTVHNKTVNTTSGNPSPFNICSNNPNPQCNAQFTYVQDATNPNKYYFTNQSTNYNLSSWYVNNTLMSNQTNFTYIFLQNPSINSICLVIYDSLNNCSDSSCTTIIINNCSTNFTYTINGLLVNFTAQSSPSADYYEWNFGDGNTQTTSSANITHSYNNAGIYPITLTTLNIYNQAQDTCFAFASDSIYVGNPSNTGSIYGYVFADSNYLNDGTIELYGKNPVSQKMDLLDSANFTIDSINSSSYFIFENKTYGNYYIKCRINNTSSFYGNFYDTWYPKEINWQSAQKVELNSSIAAANIILEKPSIFFSGGIGSIEGKVIPEQGINASQTKVYLYSSGQLAKESKLDINGKYYFDSLIYGTYTIKPELTNYNTFSHNITISQENLAHTNVNFGINSNGFYVGNNPAINNISLIKVFPNPAKDELNILINSEINGDIIITISDLLGRVVYTKTTQINHKTTIKIPINEINSGVFIVYISDNYGSTTKKFIKQ